MDCRVPVPRMVTELIIWQKQNEFGFELLIYFLFTYAILFTTSSTPQHSFVQLGSFVLTRLWPDCESKNNVSVWKKKKEKEGASNKERNVVNWPVQIESRPAAAQKLFAVLPGSAQKNRSNQVGSILIFARGWGGVAKMMSLCI